MYFVVIMAFAFVLSDGLPPPQLILFRQHANECAWMVVALQLLAVALTALVGRRQTLRNLNGTAEGHELAADALMHCHQVLLGVIATGLTASMVFTRWAPMIRSVRPLMKVPLAADMVILSPFFLSITLAWTILYSVEIMIRREALAGGSSANEPTHDNNVGGERTGLGAYLFDKFRHQILIIAAPMICIVAAKFFTDKYRLDLDRYTKLPWIGDTLLGVVSVTVLFFSPVMLRYIWSTKPLPPGPLRERFERTCARIGLKYREILLWKTHGLAVNAAVMGFIPSLRYILVSDALLTTMNDEEIEAVFGHEAGHVQHWHLHFFGLFALVASYLAGAGLIVLAYTHHLFEPDRLRDLLAGRQVVMGKVGLVADPGMLSLVALAVLMPCWLLGFGWLSRKFERQADLYGVRCITPDIKTCATWCPVHGESRASSSGLCVTAAALFGRTLLKIADLNGIPRHAPSWRHGTIDSRCQLIEQFATQPETLRKFDRFLWRLKAWMVVVSILGTAVTVWLYYPSVASALGWSRTTLR